jgi:hypothetical protein
VVDNFGIKYTHQDNIEHLIKCIKEKYKLTMDWDSNLYCSICLKWDYDAYTLDISMSGYILKQLQQYKHATPTRQQHCLYAPQPKQYGSKHNDCSPRTRLPPAQKATSNRYNA